MQGITYFKILAQNAAYTALYLIEMKHKKLIVPLIIATLLLFAQNSISVPKKRSEPDFAEMTVTTSDRHLLLFGMLKNGFTDQMIQGLHSGLPIHFSFFVELNPEAEGWKDGILASIETQHVISYDTLKETYKVEIEESGKRFFTFDNLLDAQKAANEINGLKVVELLKLKPNTSYTIRVRAELHKKTLPMGLHEVVPFVSLWDLETKWHSIIFKL